MIAVLLGIVAFPLVLVFGPAYFPWSLLVLACLGCMSGLSVPPRGRRVAHAIVVACVSVLAALAVLTVTANMALRPEYLAATAAWLLWILAPVLAGALVGTWLRARFGVVRGGVTGAGAAAAIGLTGVVLALVLAPAEVANAPTCTGGFECPRTQCAYMAERRRLFTVERVTAFDGERITCTYTAWGGFEIGAAEMGRGGGSWMDGAWPRMVTGRS